MLAINERALRDPSHDESFVKSYFYHKNLKRIEATEHYLIIHLGDHRPKASPVYVTCNLVLKPSPATRMTPIHDFICLPNTSKR